MDFHSLQLNIILFLTLPLSQFNGGILLGEEPEDPFINNNNPGPSVNPSWTRLLLESEKFSGKKISIGGWITMSNGEPRFYDTAEGAKFHRNESSISFRNGEGVKKVLMANNVFKGNAKIQFVTIEGIYKPFAAMADFELIGEFSGALRFVASDGRRTFSFQYDSSDK